MSPAPSASPSPSPSPPPSIVLPVLRHPPRSSPAHSPKGPAATRHLEGTQTLHVRLPPRHPSSGPSLLQLTPKHAVSGGNGVAAIHVEPMAARSIDHSPAQSTAFGQLDRESWWGDLKLISAFALPNSVTFLVGFLVSFTSVIFIGRLGAAEMGAAALGNMMANLLGFSIGQGMTSALDTLCSQAYGARQYELVGRHTQRAMVILTGACFPVAIIWTYAGSLLELMGIEKRICDLAGTYTYTLIIGVWPNFIGECLRRYLQSQGILWPVLVSAVTTAIVSIGLNYLLIFVYDFGFTGPAIASALANWVMLFTCIACMLARNWYRKYQRVIGASGGTTSSRRRDGETYANLALASPRPPDDGDVVCMSPPPPLSNPASPGGFSGANSPTVVEMTTMKNRTQHSFPQSNGHALTLEPMSPSLGVSSPAGTPFATAAASALIYIDPEDCWPSPFTLEIFQHWGEFLKLALPGAASLFVEWGSYEVSASMAARLGPTNLAVHSIFMQTAGLYYMIPLGIATAASICIGQFLGAKRGDRARDIAQLAMILNAIHPLLVSFFLLVALRSVWGPMFSNDADVIESCAHHLPIMILYMFFDHVKSVTMAVLRGCGRAPITVYGNTLACWLVGFPLAYLLVFWQHFELWGLWVAMSLAWAMACLVYYCVIARTDWNKEVDDAAQRTARSLGTAVDEDESTHGRQKLARSPPPHELEDELDFSRGSKSLHVISDDLHLDLSLAVGEEQSSTDEDN